MCLGRKVTTDWNPSDDVIDRITFVLSDVQARFKSDPFWMVEPGTNAAETCRELLSINIIERMRDTSERNLLTPSSNFIDPTS